VVPEQGMIVANTGSQLLQVTFNSNVPEVPLPGIYKVKLKLKSKDPTIREILIPGTMVIYSTKVYLPLVIRFYIDTSPIIK